MGVVLSHKGTPTEKKCFLSGMGGGGPWPIFLDNLFYHVLVLEIGNFLPKTLNICMLFGHFLSDPGKHGVRSLGPNVTP